MGKFLCCLLSFLFFMQIQSMAQSTSERWTVQDVVQRSTLGITQKYAEFKIGSPAITEHTDYLGIRRNLYQIGTCYVTLGIKKGSVVSVRMFVNKNCDLDVSNETSKPGKTMLSQTTFEDWARLGNFSFVEPDEMGASSNGIGEYGEFVFGKVGAATVNGMVEVQLGGGDYQDKVFTSGLETWKEMLTKAGIDYRNLPLTEPCPLHQLDEAAYQLMGKAKITSIGFGFSNTLQPACNASTDQQMRSTGEFYLEWYRSLGQHLRR
jgi:hypothetical protein